MKSSATTGTTTQVEKAKKQEGGEMDNRHSRQWTHEQEKVKV